MIKKWIANVLVLIVLPFAVFSALASNVTTIVPTDMSYFATGQPNATPTSQRFKIVLLADLIPPTAGYPLVTPVLEAGTTIEARITLDYLGIMQNFLIVFPVDVASNLDNKDFSKFCNAKIIGVTSKDDAKGVQISCVGQQAILSFPVDFMPGGVDDFNAVKIKGWTEITASACPSADSVKSAWLAGQWPVYGSGSYVYPGNDVTYFKTVAYCSLPSSFALATPYLMQSTLAQQANGVSAPELKDPNPPVNNPPSPLGPLSVPFEPPMFSGDGKTLTLTFHLIKYNSIPPLVAAPATPVDPGAPVGCPGCDFGGSGNGGGGGGGGGGNSGDGGGQSSIGGGMGSAGGGSGGTGGGGGGGGS